jgi:hypothetical protein
MCLYELTESETERGGVCWDGFVSSSLFVFDSGSTVNQPIFELDWEEYQQHVGLHHFNAYLDPDLSFHVDADPDPCQSDVELRPLIYRPSAALF